MRMLGSNGIHRLTSKQTEHSRFYDFRKNCPNENGLLCLVTSKVAKSSTSESAWAVERPGLRTEGGVTAGDGLCPGDRSAHGRIGKREQNAVGSVLDTIFRILGEHRGIVIQNSADRSLMSLQSRTPIERVRSVRL
jgi:hypothetical protein